MTHSCTAESKGTPGHAVPVTRVPLLFIGNFLSSQGGNRGACEELAARLTGRGWTVRCASRRRNRIVRLADMIWVAWCSRNRYRVAQVDVYSGSAFAWAELACVVLRAVGRPYVLTLRGGNLPEFARRWPQRVRRLLRSAADVTAPSGYLQEALAQCRPDILLLPNALETGRYEFRQRTNPQPHLVWLRAFHEIYNPQLAIRVLALLRRDFADARLTMVGPDKRDGTLQNCQRLAEELAIADRIAFVPGVPKSEVAVHLRRGDVFLNTSRIDNMPVSVVEAMACGLCVVSTDVGGVRHLISDGENGLLAPSDDAEAMTTAVRRLLTDTAVAGRVSATARECAEKLDWEMILDSWECLLGRTATHAAA